MPRREGLPPRLPPVGRPFSHALALPPGPGPGCFGGGSPGSDLAWLAEHRDASTRLLDRLAGAVAECVRLDGQLPLQAAGPKDLDVHAGVDEARLEERHGV